MSVKRPRLSRDDWTAAALSALAEGGVAAIAIEPLATRLGATKGSAYWHFANREELLRATLERWERDETESIIELVDAQPDPLSRLRTLFASVFSHPKANMVELALSASATDPLVAQIVDRVTERRIAYLASLFTQLQFSPTDARRRAVLAYSSYLGNAHLRHTAPAMLPTDDTGWNAYVDDALFALTRRK